MTFPNLTREQAKKYYETNNKNSALKFICKDYDI